MQAGSVFLLALAVYYSASVSQPSDSGYSMMVSQALIDYGTVRLDQYSIPKLKPFEKPGVTASGYPYHLQAVDGHLYYYFPAGSSVLSVPAVAFFNIFGLSAVNSDGSYNSKGEIIIERAIAGVVMAGSAALLFLTARLFLPLFLSCMVAAAGAFGTSFFSMASRALWSHTWGAFLLTFAIFSVLKAIRRRAPPNAVVLATVLAWMYFVRPTAGISIAAICVIILIYFRPIFLTLLCAGAVWAAGLVAYSQHYFGKWLPEYYSASRLGSSFFWEALAGNLVSPARGLLVYSPFFVLTLYLVTRYWRQCDYKPFVAARLTAILAHWISISMFAHWWGGHCYGPRLMTDVLPWWLAISVVACAAVRESWRKPVSGPHSNLCPASIQKKGLAGVVVLLLALSIYMHGLGAYSKSVSQWNTTPNDIDDHPERLWDWSSPPFLVSKPGR